MYEIIIDDEHIMKADTLEEAVVLFEELIKKFKKVILIKKEESDVRKI